jgi:hypothetical protein
VDQLLQINEHQVI